MVRKGILSQEEIDALLCISNLGKFENKAQAKKGRHKLLPEHIAVTPLMISSTLATKTISLQDYLNWQIDNFLPLDSLLIMTVDVAKIPLFTAKSERHVDKRVLRLIDKIDYAQRQKKE